MADDMSNTNDAHRVYTDAITAQLGERVTNLGPRQTDLKAEMPAGFKGIDAAVTSPCERNARLDREESSGR